MATAHATYKYFNGMKFHFLGERKTKREAQSLAAKYRRQWGTGARIVTGQVYDYSVWGRNIQ